MEKQLKIQTNILHPVGLELDVESKYQKTNHPITLFKNHKFGVFFKFYTSKNKVYLQDLKFAKIKNRVVERSCKI